MMLLRRIQPVSCHCRAIATLLDIPACSIRKEMMLHRSEMCISENREEILLGSGK
jgi:hypothetical protein